MRVHLQKIGRASLKKHNVANSLILRCEIFGLKIWWCKILDICWMLNTLHLCPAMCLRRSSEKGTHCTVYTYQIPMRHELQTSDSLLEILKFPLLVFIESHREHRYHVSLVKFFLEGKYNFFKLRISYKVAQKAARR